VVITGADGFLGRHLQANLLALGGYEVVGVDRVGFANDAVLGDALRDAGAVVHLAGINRDTPEAVEFGNIALAQRLVAFLDSVGGAPTVVYSNSIQSEGDSPYGRGKRASAEAIRDWTARSGATLIDLVLPNVFGEGGRPHYNSFVATFCHLLATGEQPVIDVDRTVELIHAQEVAKVITDLLGSKRPGRVRPTGRQVGVSDVLQTLTTMSHVYSTGQFPSLDDRFSVDLFNTYRSYLFPARYPLHLDVKEDQRGRFVELAQSQGGAGQTSYSTTHPGIRRGDHFHLRKIERFVVIEGEARIAIRPVTGTTVTTFEVSGRDPAIVDMPTLHTHNITNAGSGVLVTIFWANEIFDPSHPDTFALAVE
jgi:UDP-2-acetamido-2,6-beta-L-arabino-hexul-4-ose reductase